MEKLIAVRPFIVASFIWCWSYDRNMKGSHFFKKRQQVEAMFENTRKVSGANNPARNPRHWRNRGWHNDIECYEIGPGLKFDMPLAMFWTAVSNMRRLRPGFGRHVAQP